MVRVLQSGLPVIIEATANPVDQNGGYAGLTPALFRDYVWSLARECHFSTDQTKKKGCTQ